MGAINTFCAAQPDADGCAVKDLERLPLRLTEAVAAFADDGQLLDYERFVEMVSGRGQASEVCDLPGAEGDDDLEEEGSEGERVAGAEGGSVAERIARAVATAAPAAPAAAAAAPFQDFERECFKPAGDGEEACDAWYYGEDPTAPKKLLTGEADEAKVAALRAEGEALVARRAAARAAQAASRQPAAEGGSVAERIARAVATAAPAAPAAAASAPFQDFERECFKPAGDGEEACDAWYYGEDPTVPKKVLTGEADEAKVAALRAEGEALVARRAAARAAQAAARQAKG